MGVPIDSLPPHVRDLVDQQISQVAPSAAAQQAVDADWPASQPKTQARAVHTPGRMNKTEAAYARALEMRRIAGEIQRYDFEPEKLRLADRTFYEPDFRVVLANGEIEMHEVKGHWEDDARVKIKVAAALHPYRFVAVKKNAGAWVPEIFT